MAEKLTIQFSAKGGDALKKTINDLHLANVKLTKGQEEYEKVLKKLESTQKQQKASIETVKKSQEQLRKETIMGRDAKRANAHALKQEEKARKAQLAALKQDIIARNKSNQVNKTSLFTLEQMKLRLMGVVGAYYALNNVVGAWINRSAEVEEGLNKANVVFGESSDLVRGWAEGFGEDAGRSADSLVMMASTFQDTLVPMGATRESAAAMSAQMTQLAMDVASFNNKADADVIRDFQSAMVGNHETVLKYGIVIKEATLKQKAFEMGLYSGQGQLTESAKLQARMKLLFEGTADAQGDLINTQNSYTNQVKRLQDTLKDTYKELGDSVTTALVPIIQMLNVLAKPQHIVAFAGAITVLAMRMFLASKAGKAMRKSALAALRSIKALGRGAITSGKGIKGLTRNVKMMGKAFMTSTGGIMLIVSALIELYYWITGNKDEIEDLGDSYSDIQNEISNTTIAFEENGDAVSEAAEKQREFEESISDSVESLEHQLAVLRATSDIEREALRITKDREGGLASLTDREFELLLLKEEQLRINKQIQKDNKVSLTGLDEEQKLKANLLIDEENRLKNEIQNTRTKLELEQSRVNSINKIIQGQADLNVIGLEYGEATSMGIKEALEGDSDLNLEDLDMKKLLLDERLPIRMKNLVDELYDPENIDTAQSAFLIEAGVAFKGMDEEFKKFQQNLPEMSDADIKKNAEKFMPFLEMVDRATVVMSPEVFNLDWKGSQALFSSVFDPLFEQAGMTVNEGLDNLFNEDEGRSLVMSFSEWKLEYELLNDILHGVAEGGMIQSQVLAQQLRAVMGLEDGTGELNLTLEELELALIKAQKETQNSTTAAKLLNHEEKVSTKLLTAHISLMKEISYESGIYEDAMKTLTQAMGGVEFSGLNMINTFNAIGDSIRKAGKDASDLWGTYIDGTIITKAMSEQAAEFGVVLEEGAKLKEGDVEKVQEGIEVETEAQATRQGYVDSAVQITQAIIQQEKARSQAAIDRAKATANSELTQLRESRKYQKASDKEKKKLEQEIKDRANDQILKEFKSQQSFNYGAIIMDTAMGIQKAAAKQQWAQVALISAMGALQLSTVKSQQPPIMMAKGGYVGGKLHAEGGTMIEAEQGEFVMSRDAVDSVGVETMNRLNQGGGAVNISFQGNVLSDDFITDEAIPKIREAIRRGSDIGIG